MDTRASSDTMPEASSHTSTDRDIQAPRQALNSICSASDPSAPQSSSASDGVRQRRLKAHRKTRAGCFSCKRRRVKCSEERPSCQPCLRNCLECMYPATQQERAIIRRARDPQYQSMTETYQGKQASTSSSTWSAWRFAEARSA